MKQFWVGRFWVESSLRVTLLSFQARQFTRSACSLFLQIIKDFENVRSCVRTGLARLYKIYLFGDKFVRIRPWKDPCSNIQICELECSCTAYGDWKEYFHTKKGFSDVSPIIASCIKHEKQKTYKRYSLPWGFVVRFPPLLTLQQLFVID